MMDFLKKTYYFLIYTNILIACAATAQCALTYVVFSTSINWYILVVAGASTLLLYNLSFYLAKPNDPLSSPFRRTRWVFSHVRLFWFNTILGALLLLYAIYHLHLYSLLFLLGLALISLLYVLPIIPYQGRKVGLRQFPMMKIFHIAFIWSLSSVFLPAIDLYLKGQILEKQFLYGFALLKFLFIIICTLPFDIRDMRQDTYYGLQTVPNILGRNKAQQLCYYLLLIHSLGVLYIGFPTTVKWGVLLTNLLIVLLFYFYLFRSRKHYHDVYLLDVAIIIQFILVVLSNALFK